MCEAFVTQGAAKAPDVSCHFFSNLISRLQDWFSSPVAIFWQVILYLLWLILFVYPLNGNRSMIPSPWCLIKFGPLLSVPCRSSSIRSLVAAVLIELDHSRWPQCTTKTTSLPENVQHVENIILFSFFNVFHVLGFFICFPYFQFLQPSTLFDLSSLTSFVTISAQNRPRSPSSCLRRHDRPKPTEQAVFHCGERRTANQY